MYKELEKNLKKLIMIFLQLKLDMEVDIGGMLNNVKCIFKKSIYFKKIFIH